MSEVVYTIIDDYSDDYLCKAVLPIRPHTGDLVELPGEDYRIVRVAHLILESEELCGSVPVLYVMREEAT